VVDAELEVGIGLVVLFNFLKVLLEDVTSEFEFLPGSIGLTVFGNVCHEFIVSSGHLFWFVMFVSVEADGGCDGKTAPTCPDDAPEYVYTINGAA